ncbi:tetratricopeptide repeat protein [Comamonas aquatica]|uniref:L,D-transpeptidase Cds6 family protein n=1 Tax=Comamonas aquatica TaxID=225991 RepID=UPI00244A3D79|nr:tetratricopeptide repeat protein [Comamonas aquatica]MDH1378306.1 tetratricopeptide repeat protein [Comamonas aquatica]MDH1637982.1 tetratricopeptide repeat protein [Comamonas aquatica]
MSLPPVLSWLRAAPMLQPGRWIRPVTAASLMCVMAAATPLAQAAAAPAAEVQQLVDQGKINDAAQRVQTLLKQSPQDVQLRFLQGVIAAEQQKYDQAIQVFTALTRDHPQLPEPYNNLAVLHAAKGEDRKAAQVLEQAIRTNPSYATAHENLGDLYARMAGDAYAKALQLDNNRKPAPPKLSLIKQIFPTSGTGAAVVAAAPAAAPRPAAVEPKAPAAPAPTPAPAAPAVAAAPAPAVTPAAAPAPAPARVAQAAPASPAPAATPPAPAAPAAAVVEKADKTEKAKEGPSAHQQAVDAVEKAVLAWAKAWEQQNINAYYAAYSPRFDPQGGTLAAWKQERKDRIVGRDAITVAVRNLKVTLDGDKAAASFQQYYASGSYKATTRKTLRMQREGNQWRIVREETGR